MLAISGMTYTAMAQKSAVNSAKSDLDSYTALKGSPQLAEPKLKAAKESIDKAILHDKTKNDPATWVTKAKVYAELAGSAKEGADAFAQEATAALAKAKELDTAGALKEDIRNAGITMSNAQLMKGKTFYDAQKWKEAYTEFNKGLEFNPGDTTLNYAAGISAMMAKDNDAAIARFNEILPTNYSSLENVYSNLAVLYMQKGDTINALKVAGEGVAKFPKSTELATREIEFNLMAGKQAEVIQKIETQATKDPNNKLFPFYLGIAYNAANQNDKAEEAYKKAIALDDKYTDAYINISGLIMNKGIDLYNKANKLPANKQAEYTAGMKKAQAEFDRALPYLQKTIELDPKSELALKNLKTYYSIKKDQAKVQEIDAKLKAL